LARFRIRYINDIAATGSPTRANLDQIYRRIIDLDQARLAAKATTTTTNTTRASQLSDQDPTPLSDRPKKGPIRSLNKILSRLSGLNKRSGQDQLSDPTDPGPAKEPLAGLEPGLL